MNTGARVKLSWYEAAIGSYVGMLRQLASLKRGLQQCAGHECTPVVNVAFYQLGYHAYRHSLNFAGRYKGECINELIP
jgi:hypothetical protein